MDIKLSNMCQIDLGDIVEIHGQPYLIIQCPLWCSQRRTGIPTKRYILRLLTAEGPIVSQGHLVS